MNNFPALGRDTVQMTPLRQNEVVAANTLFQQSYLYLPKIAKNSFGNLKEDRKFETVIGRDNNTSHWPHSKIRPAQQKKHCYYPFRHYGKANIYPNRKKYTSQRQITIQNHSYEAPVYQWAQEFAVKVCQKSYGLGHEPKGGTFVLQMSQECHNNDACFGGAQLRSSEKFL